MFSFQIIKHVYRISAIEFINQEANKECNIKIIKPRNCGLMTTSSAYASSFSFKEPPAIVNRKCTAVKEKVTRSCSYLNILGKRGKR